VREPASFLFINSIFLTLMHFQFGQLIRVETVTIRNLPRALICSNSVEQLSAVKHQEIFQFYFGDEKHCPYDRDFVPRFQSCCLQHLFRLWDKNADRDIKTVGYWSRYTICCCFCCCFDSVMSMLETFSLDGPYHVILLDHKIMPATVNIQEAFVPHVGAISFDIIFIS
jgi:hypothetical protein